MKLCWECGRKLYGNKVKVIEGYQQGLVKCHISCAENLLKQFGWFEPIKLRFGDTSDSAKQLETGKGEGEVG